MNNCQFCGYPAPLVHVHGHYQCSVCGTNALPCCDGDNCHTNAQLIAPPPASAAPPPPQSVVEALGGFKGSHQLL